MDDDDLVVRESCIVALDAADYWGRSTSTGTIEADDHHSEEEHTATRTSFSHQKAEVVH